MSESNQPPGLPEIVDEAADTPAWVPIVGLLLLTLFALLFVVSQAHEDGDETAQPAAVEVAGNP